MYFRCISITVNTASIEHLSIKSFEHRIASLSKVCICGSLYFVVFVYVYYFPVLQAGALWPGTWLEGGCGSNLDCDETLLLWHNVKALLLGCLGSPVTQCHNCGGSIGHQFATMSMSPNINTIHIHGRSEAWCIVMNCQYSAKFSMRLRQKSWQKAITSTHAVQAKRGGRAEWSKQASPNCSPIWVEQAG